MARRGKSTVKPLWIVFATVLVIVAFIGSQFFLSKSGNAFRTVPSLDVSAYLENANSLRGNTYKIEGEVTNQLAWSPSEGRLISVGVEGDTQVLGVLVTPQFNNVNIQKGQKFIFLLEVDDKGILRTKDLVKA